MSRERWPQYKLPTFWLLSWYLARIMTAESECDPECSVITSRVSWGKLRLISPAANSPKRVAKYSTQKGRTKLYIIFF